MIIYFGAAPLFSASYCMCLKFSHKCHCRRVASLETLHWTPHSSLKRHNGFLCLPTPGFQVPTFQRFKLKRVQACSLRGYIRRLSIVLILFRLASTRDLHRFMTCLGLLSLNTGHPSPAPGNPVKPVGGPELYNGLSKLCRSDCFPLQHSSSLVTTWTPRMEGRFQTPSLHQSLDSKVSSAKNDEELL